ncbi:hypothetical protein C8C98_3523 [Acidovorax sp. 106]|nr:hypothetical protein C8C98_3523 [Acidovorax sp. 106]
MLENGDAKKKAQVTNHLGFILAETESPSAQSRRVQLRLTQQRNQLIHIGFSQSLRSAMSNQILQNPLQSYFFW